MENWANEEGVREEFRSVYTKAGGWILTALVVFWDSGHSSAEFCLTWVFLDLIPAD